jgi:hypothetical protein
MMEKIPFGIDGHTLKYTNEVGILNVRTEESNCYAVFREKGQLVRFCVLDGEFQDSTSSELLREAG